MSRANCSLPDPCTIGFAPNTHELLVRMFSARAESRPLDVLTSDGEFHSFRRQSGALGGRWHACACASLPASRSRHSPSATSPRLREKAPDIAFLSHVMFKSGLRFDGAKTCRTCARPTACGRCSTSITRSWPCRAISARVADHVFLLGGGYKYAMAGEGAGFMHAPPGFAPRPQNTGWFADFGAIEAKQGEIAYAVDGGRFLGATFDATGVYRFNAVQAMLAREELDTQAISARLAALRDALCTAIASGDAGALVDAELLRPNATGPQARFISLRHPNATHWKAKLFEHDIITDARDDVLRIGLGLYHDQADIEALCAGVKRALG